jgi:phosphotransferase system enzyme I (PtsI)
MIKGVGASEGIAIGKPFIMRSSIKEIRKATISSPDNEVERMRNAVEEARKQIEDLYHYTLKEIGEEEAKIFDAHKAILDDPEVFGVAENEILNQSVSAEWAIKEVTDKFISIFENMDSSYMKERASDLQDVTNRVLSILQGVENTSLARITEPVIVFARDITPSDTAQMKKDKVLAFVTEVGGRTSHSAIMARTLEIPAVVGAKGVLSKIKEGDSVIVDGKKGAILVNPGTDVIEEYKKIQGKIKSEKKALRELVGKETVTEDGLKIELACNIGTPDDLEGVIENDGEGIGLYRTEFLYMDRDTMPTEEEQYNAYKKVLETLSPKPVVIRTLDIGGDKDTCCFEMRKELNPFLGYRAIRISLDQVEVFKIQLRAILRASIYGNAKIMFPMVSSLEELREAKEIIQEVQQELKHDGKSFSFEIEVGIMIEIPAAAIISDTFAKEVDFFSIGTNDLIQYTTAVDRGNADICHLYSPYHPALLRLIKMTIDNGHKEGIWIGVCGEAAGDPTFIPILIGMGIDELSMSATSILKSRQIIRKSNKKKLEGLVAQVLEMGTAEEVEKKILSTLQD